MRFFHPFHHAAVEVYFTSCTRSVTIVILVFSMALTLAGCSPSAALPSDARLALEREWEELGLSWDAERQMVRAWEGDLDLVSAESNMPGMNLWCVEVEFDPQLAPSIEDSSMIWIIVQQGEGSAWSASMLMTMSSLWAYEACGVKE